MYQTKLMIHLANVLYSDKRNLNKIKKIYESSFPSDERREFNKLIELLKDDRFQLKGVFVDDDSAGFISLWNFTEFMYVEHFAIANELRGNGLGTYVLQNILNETPIKILLEVDLPSDSISFKRIKYYEKFGFVICHQEYIQPPYGLGKDAVPMFIMSKPEINDYNEFRQIVKTLHSEVYHSPDFIE